MSSISIRWDRRAVKELRALPQEDQRRIFQSVPKLVDYPLQGKALHGRWKGLRRLRVGSYRVIYGFDGSQLLISVVRVGNRRKVYR